MVTKKSQDSQTGTTETDVARTLSNDFSLTNILLLLIIILNGLMLYILSGNSVNIPGLETIGIKESMLDIEYDKVGGRANYELITEAQRLSLFDPQNQGNLEAMRQYVDSFGDEKGTNQVIDTTSGEDGATLDKEEISTIISTAAIEGNSGADIIVIEYSDMECPFCVRQYQDTKLGPTLRAEYGDKLGFAFKNNRGVNHSGTEVKALGALCAKKLGGNEAYTKFYTTVMDGSSNTTGMYNVANLPDAAKNAGVDITAWQSCVDNKETLAEFSKETEEAKRFKLTGTPGTLILNVKTGKYATVEGAYPYATFTQKINGLMAQ